MISAETVQDVLLRNWDNDRAANFYIVCSRSRKFLSNWMENLCIRFLSRHLNLPPDSARRRLGQGHPDLLCLSPPKGGHYKMEENHLAGLVRGQFFHPMELPRKIFVVTDAHKIRQDYASKLLKTLEEPHPLSSIFFLNPNSQAMLPTIESRSILLRLPTPPSTEVHEAGDAEELLPSIIDAVLDNCDDYETLEKFQQELDWCETSATYRNNAEARFFGLTSLCSNYRGHGDG